MPNLTTALLCCALAAACTLERREKPDAPDMSSLVAAYASPTRSLDDATASEVQALAESKVSALLDLDGMRQRTEMVLAGAGEETGSMSRVAPRDFSGDGYAVVEHICSGFGNPAPPVDKDAHGFLTLTVEYTEGGIDPVIFGGAHGCAEQLGTQQLQVDGAMNLYVGNAFSIGDLPVTPVVFQLANFTAILDGMEILTGDFDFQVCRGTTNGCHSGFIELLFDVPSGGTLVFFIDPATKAAGFRAANGIWTCDFVNRTCRDEQNNSVTTPPYQL